MDSDQARPERPVTLRDVAKATGLSLMTASRAVRGPVGVAPETRRKVLEAVERLGYRPSPVLSALAAHRQRLRPASNYSQIAFVTAFPAAEGWRNLPWVKSYFDGARERGAMLGYEVVNFWLRESGMPVERAGHVLYSRGIQALLLPPFPPARFRAHLNLDWEKFAAVVLGEWLAKPLLHAVAADQHQAGLLACHHLRKLGFRKIGLAMWQGASVRHSHSLADAVLGEQMRFPATGRIRPLLWKHFSHSEFRRWFATEQPDVILTNGAGELEEAIARLPRKAWRATPIVYAALNEHDPRDWNGVRVSLSRAGAYAVDRLHAMLLHGERGIPKERTVIMIEGQWQAGSDLRARAGRR